MSHAFTTTLHDGLADICFDVPGEKVNILSSETLAEFDGMSADDVLKARRRKYIEIGNKGLA